MQPQGGDCYPKEPFIETNVPPTLTATISSELTKISLISLPSLLWNIMRSSFSKQNHFTVPIYGIWTIQLKKKKSLIADSGIQLSINGIFLGLLECRKNLTVVRNKHFISVFQIRKSYLMQVTNDTFLQQEQNPKYLVSRLILWPLHYASMALKKQ